jgi:hypothetical protein
MSHQSLVNKLSTQLGISTLAISNFAGVNHSVFSYIKKGTRSIPDKAIAVLGYLYGVLANLPPVTGPQPEPEEIHDWQQKEIWCKAKLYPLQKKLTLMQQNYQQAATMLQLVDAYQINNPPGTEKQQRWIDEQRYLAKKKAKKNGWLPQQQLLLQINLVNCEADFYKNYQTI